MASQGSAPGALQEEEIRQPQETSGRVQQKERGNANEEEDAEERGDVERQEGRGNTRKEEDRERSCDGENQRVRPGTGKKEPDIRKPRQVPGGTWLHKARRSEAGFDSRGGKKQPRRERKKIRRGLSMS
ncbi:hypothetical protein NDU88_005815 [Pleurodeles waltl]|uniref:Uncharacterized protein n=1 Tax=Pleurodeles waltl TaxID=8319 RepID=A0AAV7N191_PLEWA|nr:hypothetical protein NDU88_005815 [Pleurodeles waltl]